MACLYPVYVYPAAPPNKGVVFNKSASYDGAHKFPIPCRQCMQCRLAHAREWGFRCYHESKLHNNNCILTLTYDNNNMPKTGSLSRRDIQLFIKRLRKDIEPIKIRFFAAGEYGPTNKRPHYHILIFGYDFPDKVYLRKVEDRTYYKSEKLAKLWPVGIIHTIGDLTLQGARYCAQYAIKKVNGTRAETHYYKPHPLTGEYYHVLPEFIQMSTRPGIGSLWAEKYMPNLLASDHIIFNGQKFPVPTYYLRKLDDEKLARIKIKRLLKSLKIVKTQSPHHVAAVQEKIRALRTLFKRDNV